MQNRINRYLLLKAIVIAAFQPIPSAHCQYQTIALSGQTAPGGPAGAEFMEFGSPVLNDSGRVAFAGAMKVGVGGVTADDQIGIWTNVFGPITPVTVGDPPAPGVPGAVFEVITSAPKFSNPGTVYEEYQLEQGVGGVTAADDVGGWLFSPGNDQLVYRENGSLPGMPPDARIYFASVRMNAEADLALISQFQIGYGGVTTSNNRGIWIDTGTGLQKVLQRGDPALGAPIGAIHENFGLHSFNDNAVVAGTGTLRTGFGGISTNDDDFIYSNRSGPIVIEYREGGIATGSAVFDFFGDVEINNGNRLAVIAALKSGIGGVTSNNADGVWVETPTGLRQVARTNDLMPGQTLLRFRSFGNLRFNDAGRVAFTSSSTSSITFNTIFSEGINGNLSLVAREGTQAPDTPPGVNFDFDSFDFPGIPQLTLNAAGQVAFIGGLAGTGVNAANNLGLWAQDATGTLKLIIREGNPLEIAPGDVRTVQQFSFGNMNELGQVVFSAIFTDGSAGLFISNLVTPNPGDFNANGVVDVADYVLWRNGGPLANDNTPGVQPSDYDMWRSRFGNTASSGTGVGNSGTVPEPATAMLIIAAIARIIGNRRSPRALQA